MSIKVETKTCKGVIVPIEKFWSMTANNTIKGGHSLLAIQ